MNESFDLFGAMFAMKQANDYTDAALIPDVSATLPATLVPGIKYYLTSSASASLTFGFPSTGTIGTYCYVQFISGSTATTLTMDLTYAVNWSYTPSVNSLCTIIAEWNGVKWVPVSMETPISVTIGTHPAYTAPTASGTGTGGTMVTGVNAHTFAAAVTLGAGSYYFWYDTDHWNYHGQDEEFSDIVTGNVNLADYGITISGTPANEDTITVVYVAGSTQITVAATATMNALSYQWQDSADNTTFVNISGKTAVALAVADMTLNKYYRCVVSAVGAVAKNSNSVQYV